MSHLTYEKMIISAIAALKDRTGSNLQAIKKAISAAYPALAPATINRSTNAALKKLTAAGTVEQSRGFYKLSAKTRASTTKKPAAKKKPAAAMEVELWQICEIAEASVLVGWLSSRDAGRLGMCCSYLNRQISTIRAPDFLCRAAVEIGAYDDGLQDLREHIDDLQQAIMDMDDDPNDPFGFRNEPLYQLRDRWDADLRDAVNRQVPFELLKIEDVRTMTQGCTFISLMQAIESRREKLDGLFLDPKNMVLLRQGIVAGASIEAREPGGNSPLMLAAGLSGEAGVVATKMLLAGGADVNYTSISDSVIQCASYGGNATVIKLLLEAGANPLKLPRMQQDNKTLCKAVGNLHVEAVRVLVEWHSGEQQQGRSGFADFGDMNDAIYTETDNKGEPSDSIWIHSISNHPCQERFRGTALGIAKLAGEKLDEKYAKSARQIERLLRDANAKDVLYAVDD